MVTILLRHGYDNIRFTNIIMIENLTESKEFCELLGLPYGEFAFNGCIIGYQANESSERNRYSFDFYSDEADFKFDAATGTITQYIGDSNPLFMRR